MANNLLKRLGLVDHLEFVLDTDRHALAERLSLNVENDQSDFSDLFSSSKCEYKGNVTANGFSIRRRKRWFDTSPAFCKVNGVFQDVGNNNGQVRVSVEINAFSGRVRLMTILIGIFYGVAICATLGFGIFKDPKALFGLLGVVIHGFLMVGILYLVLRKSTRRMKYDIERDLFYIAHSSPDKAVHPL